MMALSSFAEHLHRALPLLALGLAVLGLLGIVTSPVWWPGARALPPPPSDPLLIQLTRIESLADLLEQPKAMKFLGGAVVTIPVLICSLYVIVSRRYKDEDKKWAYGAIGTLLGFWLGAT
jgi:hypothetical protein